jgi:hypothetical protein
MSTTAGIMRVGGAAKADSAEMTQGALVIARSAGPKQSRCCSGLLRPSLRCGLAMTRCGESALRSKPRPEATERLPGHFSWAPVSSCRAFLVFGSLFWFRSRRGFGSIQRRGTCGRHELALFKGRLLGRSAWGKAPGDWLWDRLIYNRLCNIVIHDCRDDINREAPRDDSYWRGRSTPRFGQKQRNSPSPEEIQPLVARVGKLVQPPQRASSLRAQRSNPALCA